MNILDATAEDISKALKRRGLPDAVINTLFENYIDGQSLLSLVADLDEFQHLVPQSALRMKIKKIVQELKEANNLLSFDSEDMSIKASQSTLESELLVAMGITSHFPEESGEIYELEEAISSQSFIKHPLSNKTTPQKPKRIKLSSDVDKKRLPIPCPLPTVFSKTVHMALTENKLGGTDKLRMLRESASFFYGICPVPKPAEYQDMSRALCDKYPSLKDLHAPNGEYWVNYD
uniref:Uncharacterized protein n=1 Tax=Amphimedon queenslandica TaxID=400682 RepID=A0A1X7TSD2_AMPQE